MVQESRPILAQLATLPSKSSTFFGLLASPLNLFSIEYRNIQVSNISIYGIDVQQDYLNGGPTGTPTNGVIIKNITMANIVGTAQAGARDYYILCGNGSCSDFTFNNIHVAGGTNSSCNIKPTGNFQCV